MDQDKEELIQPSQALLEINMIFIGTSIERDTSSEK
jgi:hypothetical protein